MNGSISGGIMTMKYLALPCLVLILSCTIFTHSSAEDSLREQALIEYHSDEFGRTTNSSKKSNDKASDAQVEGGMLSLKDPHIEIASRSMLYFMQLSLQRFQASGTTRSDLGYTFDLGRNDSTLMPALALGSIVPIYETEQTKWQWGVGAKVAYANQKSPVTFATGYTEEDVRLSTLLMSASPFVLLSQNSRSWLVYRVGFEFGNLSYTQTSKNELASFSKQATFSGWNIGIESTLLPRWSLFANYAHRKLNSENSIDLPHNNFELGTQVVW